MIRYELIKTPDGFMVEDKKTGTYLCDDNGDNLFNSRSYAIEVMVNEDFRNIDALTIYKNNSHMRECK